jgi:hypothetical protein
MPAALVVQRAFGLDGSPDEVHRKPSGYRATHVLVPLVQADAELSIRGAICEIQVTSIASHVFNEIEHDIRYKTKDVAAGERVHRTLGDLQHASCLLDSVVEWLQDERAREIDRSKKLIDDAETLRFVVERIFERPITGEVEKLFRLLLRSTNSLTVRAVEDLDLVRAAKRGAASRLLRNYPADDVVEIVLGLLDTFQEEFRAIASSWRGPQTMLKRAIMDNKAS